ncbi:MAG: polysaccharide biosynthesis/export family protein [Flavobacterium sp.]
MLKKLLLLIFISLFFASCANKKDILYYQDVVSGGQNNINYLAGNIEVNDILYIKVAALIPESVEPFNIQTSSLNNTNLGVYRLQGYLVLQDGTITFPVLGNIKVSGKSPSDVQNMISKMLIDKDYVKEPTVSVRIVNNKVSVLGEVKAPGTYPFDEQNISLNQAIGYASDLTINGSRKDVLLIREINGVRTYIKLDLTSSKWFNGPYYYVKQNDVIIVNPNGPKVMTAGYITNIGTLFSVVSFALTLILLLKK